MAASLGQNACPVNIHTNKHRNAIAMPVSLACSLDGFSDKIIVLSGKKDCQLVHFLINDSIIFLL